MSDVEQCGKCGQPHVRPRTGKPSCTGHATGGYSRPERRGQPCQRPPMRGQAVCRSHGGSAPQAKAAAVEALAQAEADRQMAKIVLTFGEPGDEYRDPGDVIAEQIRWRHAHVQWLRARVQTITPDALVWGKTKVKKGGDDFGTTREAKPNIWLQLYLEAQTALEKLCLEAIRAGMEERRVRIAEQQADILVRLLDGILTDLGHDLNAPETADVVERHLRLVGE